MKKVSLVIMSLSMALLSKGQMAAGVETVTFDEKEDTTQITTIADIVETQESLSSRYSKAAHFDKVWSYKSYFDMAYITESTLKPKEDIRTGVNNLLVPTFKADWGASLVLGHNYGLHRPIAGIAKFNIDYSYIDLTCNHFKAEGEKIYDYNADNNGNKYFPWCMEKYEFNYGMSVGPSLTVAPFTMLKSRELHFFRFNFFYHIGYHVSAMLVKNNTDHYVTEPSMKPDPMTFNFGHGLTQSFGVRMSWRTIGFGYEHRTGKLDYVPLQTSEYGKQHSKFGSTTNRIFLEIRY